ncbi:MAG: hypothetical protein MJ009_06185 [Paludibacteraceae bacterium]|nr:hypothetical protein [Paludibacteraceae bacterium]
MALYRLGITPMSITALPVTVLTVASTLFCHCQPLSVQVTAERLNSCSIFTRQTAQTIQSVLISLGKVVLTADYYLKTMV